MSKKAFVISIDSMLALILSALLIVYIVSILSTTKTIGAREPNLEKQLSDTLLVLEKSGTLAYEAKTNRTSEVGAVLGQLPHLHARLKIWDNSTLFLQTESVGYDCGAEAPLSRRSFLARVSGTTMECYAEITGCYK